MQHAQQVGTATTGRVADSNTAQRFQYGFWVLQARRVVAVHELLKRGGLLVRQSGLQVAFESLLTHERHNAFRRVIATRFMSTRYKVLEYFAQHLRVNGYF